MQLKHLIILFCLCCFSCQNKSQESTKEKFDKTKWVIKDGREYPYRDKMLNDLMNSITLKGLKQDAVLNLLGEPTRSENGYLYYTIAQQFLGQIPIPLHTKTLVIKLGKDSTVEWRKIHQ